MNLQALSDQIGEILTDNWMKALGGAVLFLLGRLWGRRRAQRDWRAKRFLHRIIVSLSSIREDGERPLLAIRTLLEKDLTEVFLNDVAVQRVVAAAARTSEADPILPIGDADRWYLLNAVLNEVAEKFAAGAVARDLGLPVVSRRYVVCLTNEVAGAVRTRKVRAMVVRKDLLESRAFERELDLESPSHATRLDTLRAMRERLERQPDHFLEVEISLPAPGVDAGATRAA